MYENVVEAKDYRHYAVSNNYALLGVSRNANDVNLRYTLDGITWTALLAPYTWNDIAANPDDGFFFVTTKSTGLAESKCRRYNEVDWSFVDVCDSTGVVGLAGGTIDKMDYHPREKRLFAFTDITPFILYSQDNGVTWTGTGVASGVPTAVTGKITYIESLNRMVVVSERQTSAYSEDDGLTWHFQSTFPYDARNAAISDEGDKVIFASWSGTFGVFTTTDGSTVSAELSGTGTEYNGVATSQCLSTITQAPTSNPI